jgi:hypothetical protein
MIAIFLQFRRTSHIRSALQPEKSGKKLNRYLSAKRTLQIHRAATSISAADRTAIPADSSNAIVM